MSDVLKEKVVVVTGGAGLIGGAFCTAIAAAGGSAVIADVAIEAAELLAEQIRTSHGAHAAVALPLDMTVGEQVDDLIGRVHERFGRIDALVNNAYPRHEGYGRRLEGIEYEHFCTNISLHVGGYFLCTQRFAKYFFIREHGNVINMGSIYGVVAPRFQIYDETSMTMPVEYAVIKAGILHLTRYFAQYYKPHHIRVNAISPGGLEADQPEAFTQNYTAHALGRRMLQPGDLAGTLTFLLSDASSHITGQNIIVDDGWTL